MIRETVEMIELARPSPEVAPTITSQLVLLIISLYANLLFSISLSFSTEKVTFSSCDLEH